MTKQCPLCVAAGRERGSMRGNSMICADCRANFAAQGRFWCSRVEHIGPRIVPAATWRAHTNCCAPCLNAYNRAAYAHTGQRGSRGQQRRYEAAWRRRHAARLPALWKGKRARAKLRILWGTP